ncbi:follistatin-A-like isoform X3 [Oculina patagonica]
MLSMSLGMFGPVTFVVIYASLIWPSMEGAKVCFINRSSSGTQCKHMSPEYSSSSTADCCQSPLNKNGNLHYAIVSNDKPIPLLLLFIQARTCLPCPGTPPIGVTTTNPCDNKDACPSGTICKVKPNGKVKCASLQPVCGTDGNTYKNEHELRKKALRDSRSDIEVAYDGTCQTGCDNVVCRKNGTCIVDQYNRAFCVQYCNVHCSGLLKMIGPLCGADGVEYKNICHLRMATCKQGKAIGMAYKGKCIAANASCDNINCGNKLCVEDASGRPRCVTCSCVGSDSSDGAHGCPEQFHPMIMCGSDGKTYMNYSSLRKKMCTTKAFIDVDHLGPCADDPLPQKEEDVPCSKIVDPDKLDSDDIGKYYISLKHFVNILRKEFGLNITSPKYKRLKPENRIVLMSKLIKALKKNWRKIK